MKLPKFRRVTTNRKNLAAECFLFEVTWGAFFLRFQPRLSFHEEFLVEKLHDIWILPEKKNLGEKKTRKNLEKRGKYSIILGNWIAAVLGFFLVDGNYITATAGTSRKVERFHI